MKTPKQKTFRSAKLISYHGGGYDGCYWEPNFALLVDNVFHDVGSSGRRAIKSKEDLIQTVKDGEKDCTIYNLNKPKDVDAIATDIHENYLGSVIGKVNEIINMELLYFACTYCETKHSYTQSRHENYPQFFHDPDNYSGNGGIGVNMHSLICEDCFCNTCQQCNSIFSPDDEIHQIEKPYTHNGKTFTDHESVCEYCFKEHEKKKEKAS